jgi:hypothetical protein
MKTPLVTLTSKELLLLSPEVHMKWKEQITAKRVPQEGNNLPVHMNDRTEIVLEDPYKT